MAVTVKIGQRFPLTIKRLDINGAGIGYYQRKIKIGRASCRERVYVLV